MNLAFKAEPQIVAQQIQRFLTIQGAPQIQTRLILSILSQRCFYFVSNLRLFFCTKLTNQNLFHFRMIGFFWILNFFHFQNKQVSKRLILFQAKIMKAYCGHIEIPQLGPKLLKITTFWKFLLNKMVKNSPLGTVKNPHFEIIN